jgi:serine protease AprX
MPSLNHRIACLLLGVALLGGLLISPAPFPAAVAPPAAYIVQAADTAAAAAAVTQAGGLVTTRLALIAGVAALLDTRALAALRGRPDLRLFADAPVHQADDANPDNQQTGDTKPNETDTQGELLFPAAATNVSAIQSQTVFGPQITCGADGQVTVSARRPVPLPLRGGGVTVAVVDSGLLAMQHDHAWDYQDRVTGTLVAADSGRCIVYRDFLPRTPANANSGDDANNSVDQNGHGTHVTATIADARRERLADRGRPSAVGVAPDVNLVVARALDSTGVGSYSQVIAALDWIVANQAEYNIRVLNLSLDTPVVGPYWADPLDQAVMRVWQAGITVVVAAGNSGPGAATITAPGNVPYVITVGAIKSGRYTASGYDELATYSSRGPTESAFVKPDVLVPASRTIAPLPSDSLLTGLMLDGRIQERAQINFGVGNFADQHSYYYQLSGTSMAAAEVSGIVALMLQAQPALTNDQVKYRLLATARTAIDPVSGQPVYSIWEQGAGLVNAPRAVFTTAVGTANTGMDLGADLAGTMHYWGYTVWDPVAGIFRLAGPEGSPGGQVTGGAGQAWSGAGQAWSGAGQAWSGAGQAWSGAGQAWSGAGQAWSGAGQAWSGSTELWAGSTRIWVGAAPASVASPANATVLLNDP